MQFIPETGEPVDAEPNVEPVRADVYAFDEELDNARLFSREEFVPERVYLEERLTDLRLGEARLTALRGPPRARDDLWLAEHRPELVDDGGLDLTGRYTADRASPGAMLQHRLADVIAVEPVALVWVGEKAAPSGP